MKMPDAVPTDTGVSAARPLVVLVPNHTGRPEALEPLRNMLEATTEFGGAHWLIFDYRQPLWSNKDPEKIARDLAATIDNEYEIHKGEIGRIVLAGHSMGTAILRRAYLNARGFGSAEWVQKKRWADKVDRIVLMGAIGRGFDAHKLPLRYRVPVLLWVSLARFFRFGRMRREVFSGGDFVTCLRVDWIRFNRGCESHPTIVHLLGSSDEFVREEDVIDIEQFPTVFPVEVPGATHAGVAKPGPTTRVPLLRAFLEDPEATRDVTPPAGANEIYFLMHGIRASKSSFEAIAREIEASRPNVTVVHPTYGYLSMRGFLSAAHRNSYVPWFVDQYAECLARNPRADFHYAGHSNGTYILGEALERIPNMTFKRVYLAGSVLPQEYDWERVIDDRGQVELVRSDRGCQDWAVGVVARALHGSFWKSIGSGGFDQFSYGARDRLAENVFPGGHSDMLHGDERVHSIAGFLTNGSPARCGEEAVPEPTSLFKFLHKFGYVLLPVAVAGLLVPLVLLAKQPGYLGKGIAAGIVLLAWIVVGRL